MRWKLFEATWVCAWRRLRPVLAANPLLSLLAAVATVAFPVGALVAGARLAPSFAAVAGDELFARVLAIAVAAPATVAGAVVAVLAPGVDSLGRQLAAAPVARRTVAPVVTVAPALAFGSLLGVPLALFAVPLAGRNAVPLLLAPAACALLGAAAVEGAVVALRREPRGVVLLVAAAAVWAAVGVGFGFGEAGSAAALVPALVGAGIVVPSLTLAGATALGVFLWTVASAIDRRDAAARTTVLVFAPLPRNGVPAAAAVVAKRLVRQRQLRLNVAATLLVPVAAAGALQLTLGTGGDAVVAFCVAVAITAAATFPAAATGLAEDARWLLRAAPQRASLLAIAAAAGGVGVALSIVALDTAAVATFSRAAPTAYLELEGTAAFVLGCAAVAGALVRWRSDAVVQQLATYGALVAVALTVWLAVGKLEGHAEAVGLGAPIFGLVVGNGVLVGGLAAAGALAR